MLLLVTKMVGTVVCSSVHILSYLPVKFSGYDYFILNTVNFKQRTYLNALWYLVLFLKSSVVKVFACAQTKNYLVIIFGLGQYRIFFLLFTLYCFSRKKCGLIINEFKDMVLIVSSLAFQVILNFQKSEQYLLSFISYTYVRYFRWWL